MPIQFPDFQRISFDEANPMLVGMERGQKLGQSAMMFPQEMQAKMLANKIAEAQAKYAEPMAKEGLTKAQQENQWNPKIWQSEIGLRGASAGKLNKETAWYDREAASRIASQTALTQGTMTENQMSNLKLKYLQQMLGGMAQQNAQPQQGGAPGMGGGAPGGMPQQGGGGMMPQQQQQPANNSIYGIETPTLTAQDVANKMLLGIDTFKPKMENAKAQQQDQYMQYQKALGNSIQEANAGNNLSQAISVFNNAMDKSSYKGSRWGNLPSSGLASPPGDLTSEQEADRAAIQMIPAAVETLKDAMGQARFSNLDMGVAQKMKFDRTMNDETRTMQTQWINGVNDRLQEKGKFLSSVASPSSGIKKSEADQLWSAYQQDFPLISKDGKTFQATNLGNWPLYTTPKAIASIRATGTYSPSAKEKNVFMMQVPDGKGGYVVAPVKKGRVESAFRKGARPL